ncbi:MAG: hypothetical protein TEF_12460 [Rhizobiales bacterium NRL2]|jgi:exopolyphosphatase/guanosine-5'-triphosphate,3'-diphosphate pyrophosphatase|nr:MAG: hypothetical protein TEF_12460 [Rhizobiales bacterium NRL2]
MPDSITARSKSDRIAVVDVGSNSVRLVIFGDCERAPLAMLNERAFCSLGKGLGKTGRLNPEGVDHALKTLRRFDWMSRAAGASRVFAFATAAVRDARDGAEFVERARRETGIDLRVLTGPEEANLAGLGVLFGLPDAQGVVGDLGGSSLELAPIRDRKVLEGATLPVGPLQFPADSFQPAAIRRAVHHHLDRLDWLEGCAGQDLYLVGGTWRAVAKLDIGMRNYGLNIIHGYEMTPDRAIAIARLIARQSPESLAGAEGISNRRLQVLPAASLVLEAIVDRLAPPRLVFSAHGVREGAYLECLSEAARDNDPLLAGVEALARHEARFSPAVGKEIFDWTGNLFAGETAREARLRMAACLLCDVGWRTHPDYRATQSYRRVLRAPLLAVSHADRAFLAVTMLRRYSHKAGRDVVDEARTLLSDDQVMRAERIGGAMRLAQTLTGGAPGLLPAFSLELKDRRITLAGPAPQIAVIGESVQSRLKRLAGLFDADEAIVAL